MTIEPIGFPGWVVLVAAIALVGAAWVALVVSVLDLIARRWWPWR